MEFCGPQLALRAAEQRLLKTRRNLHAFVLEHQDLAPSIELQHSVECERDMRAVVCCCHVSFEMNSSGHIIHRLCIHLLSIF